MRSLSWHSHRRELERTHFCEISGDAPVWMDRSPHLQHEFSLTLDPSFLSNRKVIRSLVLPRTRLDSGFQSGFEGLDQDHIVCVLPKPNTFSLLLSYLAKGLRRLSPGTRPA